MATVTRMPKALARAATALPIWPKPSRPMVLSPISRRSGVRTARPQRPLAFAQVAIGGGQRNEAVEHGRHHIFGDGVLVAEGVAYRRRWRQPAAIDAIRASRRAHDTGARRSGLGTVASSLTPIRISAAAMAAALGCGARRVRDHRYLVGPFEQAGEARLERAGVGAVERRSSYQAPDRPNVTSPPRTRSAAGTSLRPLRRSARLSRSPREL